jgi:asparagine synthase (glutamine-hydrolysing)
MNIVGCVGLSREFRRSYLSRLESGMRMFDWLQVGYWELPSSTILCAVNSLARVDVQCNENAAQLYLGSVSRKAGLPAEKHKPVSGHSSYFLSELVGELYLAFASRADGACCISVDALGMFPVYYYSTTEFFLFSSSLWPFDNHPNISSELDLDGLIGIFLSQGIVGGRTILRGVARLSAGNAVTWKPGRLAAEQQVNRLKPTADLFDSTLDKQIEAVDAALHSATTRRSHNMLLLSGGLDSRLLAGYLSTTDLRDFQAISLGSSWQFDAAFAAMVARRLGWRHRAIDVNMSHFLDHATALARHEQLAGSFLDLAFCQIGMNLSPSDPAIVTGFCGNNALEPLRHDPNQTEFTFARVFKSCNKYGFPPDTLRTLLRVDNVDERIAAVIERLQYEYESVEGEPFQKVLMFDLSHRTRFLIGAVAWRLSFGMRPTLPYADRDLLTASVSLPVTAFRDRKLQKALLCRRFPELARLPLDTATFFTRPLMPTLGGRARHLMLLIYHGLLSQRERRYYHSVFDLNGPGWRAVRHEAEKSRAKAESILDRDILIRLLPPPGEDIRTRPTDFFQVGSRKKSLLAFMLWASEHL